jgi:IS605 OrfB family transposase
LLTLRGGLDHTLADAPVKGGRGKSNRAPSEDERRDRRVLLALSWLSVEDERGAPNESGVIVAYGDGCTALRDSQDGRDRKVCDALRCILVKRGLDAASIDAWMNDCQGSLKARIRDDAVWVNRSEMFDSLASSWAGLTRANSQPVLADFFGPVAEWVTLPVTAAEGDGDEASSRVAMSGGGGGGDGVEFRTSARNFLSTNFGTGAKSNKRAISDALTRAASSLARLGAGCDGSAVLSHLCTEFDLSGTDDEARFNALRERIGWKTGRPSKGHWALSTARRKTRLAPEDIDLLGKALNEEAEAKLAGSKRSVPPWINSLKLTLENAIGFGYVTERNLIGEFGVMLDHAARRVSINCSWIKRAELERRQFETDAKKLDQVRAKHASAAAFLDEVGRKRARESGSSAGTAVLIRKRAIMGWKEVVAAWSRQSCKTVQDRIEAARLLQGELEKFGDNKFFEELAVEDARVVWQNADGVADSTILERYSAGSVAEANQQRFKVPAYRHPDPLRHPVFGDFGVSRWEIAFALHERVRAAVAAKSPRRSDAEWYADPRNLRMGLWTGQRVEMVSLRWSSKRLTKDLALSESIVADSATVTRADRLGRASVGHSRPVNVVSVFEEVNWNGRLQAPRDELDRVAQLTERGEITQARKLRDRISWFVSFSPKLAPSGPFIDYAAAHGIKPSGKTGEYWPHSAMNRDRQGHHAKFIYARLPGLRVLSVDLGHRFSAACAVWEAMSALQVNSVASQGKIVRGGTSTHDLFVHVETKNADGRLRTTVFRRVGSDKLPDGSIHPAPWAKLERQFLIKLQGEERQSRMAAPDELASIGAWEKALGRQPFPETSTKPSKNVAELMARNVRMFTLAARRHFDRARIAHNLTAKHRSKPGGKLEALTEDGRIELLTETLALWHGLFAGVRWTDPKAQKLWDESGLPKLDPPAFGDDDGTLFERGERKAAKEEYQANLRRHAERLAPTDLSKLSKQWTDRWAQDDKQWTTKDGLLRSLRNWVAPRGLRLSKTDSDHVKKRKVAAALRARHVGGLSMQRINTLTGLYRLLKSFKNRPEPDNLRKNIPEKGDDRLIGFNQRLLDVRDRLRQQRVKQLASRITEAALGIGRIKSRSVAAGAARPTSRVDAPCHAIVIESLTNYRPDELQTRRENRQLMEWSSAKVAEHLKESCQLHGLHLREVQPNYTSRQCSRTGAPGLRAVEVSAHELLTKPWWKKDVAKAKANVVRAERENRKGAFSDQLMVRAEEWALRLPEQDRQDRPSDSSQKAFHAARIILPRKGGDLFISVSTRANSKGHIPALQADLNAAANIGIRALLDPDWAGKWWWVPCTGGTLTPSPEKTGGAYVFKNLVQLPHEREAQPPVQAESDSVQRKKPRNTAMKEKEVRSIENRWRSCSSEPLDQGQWQSSGEYWSKIEAAICCLLGKQVT